MSLAASGVGTTFSSSFYLRKFYKNCSDASKTSKRSKLEPNRLSQADADALHKAVKQLRNFKFTDDDNSNLHAGVSAFLETYNHTMDSCKDSSDLSVKRYAKQLKSLVNNHKDELEDIGVTVNKDGTLTANSNLLKSASVSKIKKLFSKESDFSTKAFQYSRHLEEKSEEAYKSDIIEQSLKQKEALLNGLGQSVDLSL